MEPIVNVQNLYKRFGNLEVLKGIRSAGRAARSGVPDRPIRIGQEHAAALYQLP